MHVAQNLVTDTLNVQGMTCASCERRLEEALSRVSGVVKAKASYSRSTVQVRYDSDRTTLDQLTDAIEATGYQVAAATPGQRAKARPGHHTGRCPTPSAEQCLGSQYSGGPVYRFHTSGFRPCQRVPRAEAGMSTGSVRDRPSHVGPLHRYVRGINLSQCVPLHTPAGAGARGRVSDAAFSTISEG